MKGLFKNTSLVREGPAASPKCSAGDEGMKTIPVVPIS